MTKRIAALFDPRRADRTVWEAGLLVALVLVAALVAGCEADPTGGTPGTGVPAAITAKVAVYFGTEQDARAFADGVQVQPPPNGHAAAILYCLD
jgi:hypothetical protein